MGVEAAARFFYALQAIRFLSARDRSVLELLNQAPVFWRTNMGALQEATFTALGRVFDEDGRTHNVDRLLKVAQANPGIFTASALRTRKRAGAPVEPDWLDDYVANAYLPRPEDWRRLRKHVRKWRGVYATNYKNIRHRVYAHRERITLDEKAELFGRTSYEELEKLLAFLDALHEALWQLYNNGRKPVIRYRRRSIVEMLSIEAVGRRGTTAGERIARDTKQFLERHVSRHRRLDE